MEKWKWGGGALRNTQSVSFIVELSTAEWRGVIGQYAATMSLAIRRAVRRYKKQLRNFCAECVVARIVGCKAENNWRKTGNYVTLRLTQRLLWTVLSYGVWRRVVWYKCVVPSSICVESSCPVLSIQNSEEKCTPVAVKQLTAKEYLRPVHDTVQFGRNL